MDLCIRDDWQGKARYYVDDSLFFPIHRDNLLDMHLVWQHCAHTTCFPGISTSGNEGQYVL